jgi:hypothetical protein
MAFGTLTTFDTLATTYNTTVAKFGEDRAFEAINESFTAHNALMSEMLDGFVEKTTDRLRRYGGPDTMAMEEMDEFGTPDAQKIGAGETVGFPMRFYGIGLQWTRLFFKNATPAELAAQVTAAQDADVKAVMREVKRAIFSASAFANYTFVDRRTDHISLGVKGLINADSSDIPVAPDGTTFDGTSHTHYHFSDVAAMSATELTTLIEDVLEHFLSGEVEVYINRAQETAVSGLSGFTAFMDARIIQASTTAMARGGLDMTNLTNRAIGIFGPAVVWVKPWMPSGYVLVMHKGGQKVLAMRTREAGGGNLELLFDNEQYPLRARAMGREFGIGVWNRVGGAALFIDAANNVHAWQSATIT